MPHAHVTLVQLRADWEGLRRCPASRQHFPR
jgi:hypothetical protein